MSDKKKALTDIDNDGAKIMKDYLNDRDLQTKYASIAGLAKNMGNPNYNMGEASRDIWFYACEDGDQGRINSASIYANNTGKMNKVIDNVRKRTEADRDYENTCKELVNEALGTYGNEKSI